MHIVSDFDGVWTDPMSEAAAIGLEQERALAAALAGDRAAARALLEPIREHVRRAPHRHGWSCARTGALSCFADEDPYVFHNAVAEAIWNGASPAREALQAAGYEGASDFARHCFETVTGKRSETARARVDSEVVEVLLLLLERGHDVTIVSNSCSERIVFMLTGVGLDPAAHPRLRLCGDARKFELDSASESDREAAWNRFAGRAVRIDRPRYLQTLEALEPDLVIGDNLSLDLATPLWLRSRAGWAKALRVVLKRNAYTPRWALEAACESGMEVLDSFAALAHMDGHG